MAEKLVSMRMSKSDAKKLYEGAPSSIATDQPRYPYGLTVQLDDSVLKKLDLDTGDVKVGTSMLLIAKVEVTGVRSNKSTQGAQENVELQITDLCLEEGSDTAAVTAALYDKE